MTTQEYTPTRRPRFEDERPSALAWSIIRSNGIV